MTEHEPSALWRVGVIFTAFAFNYFLSALLRAVVATLAPEFARELQLGAGELGLLAGAYFLGFACMQLPVGWLLDRYGARRVLLAFGVTAVLGCVGFALARNFGQLVVGRLLIGMGVSASLMAPLTAFLRLFDRPLQLRLNSWMLMSGSLGTVASTSPVQALLPSLGWRNLFFGLAAALVAAWALIAWGWPLGAVVLLAIIVLGPAADTPWLALWCACTSVISLCQPAVAQAYPKAEAGRALSAFNLLIFLGVFAGQWGMGLAIDALMTAGWAQAPSHRAAMALLLLGTIAAGTWYWAHPRLSERRRLVAARG